MKITFLGTSHGVPEVGRKCACILITVGKNRYFIDMGMQVNDYLIDNGIDFDSVKGVFISHMHGDHTHGLPAFIDLADWYFKAYSPKFLLPRESGVKTICDWIEANRVYSCENKFPLKADISSFGEGKIFDDGIIWVYAKQNQHIADSYSFLICAEDKRILYTGDMKNPQIDFPLSLVGDGVDLLICEGVHFPLIDYTDVLKNLPVKKIYVTHYMQKRMNEIENLSAAVQKEICVATDGLETLL